MRPIHRIARDVLEAWPKPYFGAVPYLQAMLALTDVEDRYGLDSAESIVLYFLSNATGFRGPKAKALKAELKAAVGVKQ